MKELRAYFEMLTEDFAVQSARFCAFRDDVQHLNWKGRLRYDKKNLIPAFREGLVIEVDLPAKRAGITIVPEW